MSQTEKALVIAVAALYLIAPPFYLLMAEALATDNQLLMAQIIPVGFGLALFCLAVIIIGVWLDGL
jgi:hypothetical protein